ncbi:enkurin-like [Clytia hemisphaerica]|uniref:Enkurin domain-containing protein n=1 Tax=Clytia hemisphaerica TaxID=252671 RepID=A0A7M5X0E0_9CNID|eukprot:TCONS_00065276-protein
MYGRSREKEESIYNLIPKTPEKPPKAERHVSKFHSTVKGESKHTKKENKTMGPSKVTVNEPDQFLKKRSKHPTFPDKKEFKYPDNDQRRPPVPKHTEKPAMGIKSDKNFISTNAVDNIMSVPKKPAANYVDTRTGTVNALEPSGLTPKYLNKKEYGKTPTYLIKRNEEAKQAQADYDEYVEESLKRGAMKCLNESERQNIISGLKANWEEIHHQYQGLSVVTDTAPKKNRKERMEAEMDQLEKDIDLLEKHPKIYIANTGMAY